MATQLSLLAAADRAWQTFSKGWASGEWTDYQTLLAPEMTFSFPIGPHRGRYTGREGREQMLAKIASDAATGFRLRFTPLHISANDDTVVYEYDAEGSFDGYPYRSWNVIAFGLRDGLVTAYREYFGDIDLALFNQFAAPSPEK